MPRGKKFQLIKKGWDYRFECHCKGRGKVVHVTWQKKVACVRTKDRRAKERFNHQSWGKRTQKDKKKRDLLKNRKRLVLRASGDKYKGRWGKTWK